MQISPINPINLISPLNPVAASAAVSPAPSVGTRNQADTTQTGTGGGGRPAIYLKQGQGEFKLTFPSGYAGQAEDTLHGLEEVLRGANLALNFSRDDETGAIVVKFINQLSGETVQQIPSEALLHLSAALRKFQGQILDQHV
jgi:hypothetical protein